ncbi:MAG TPA: hypothetical protein VGH94_03815 [Acidimicrobiales bacterium]|jgi:hypothetical protein
MLFAERRFTNRVARGAALLDEREPGWFNAVSPGILNVCSENDCVLGQIGRHRYGIRRVAPAQPQRGGYSYMMQRLGLHRPVRYGFMTFGGKERIERLWRTEIGSRVGHPARVQFVPSIELDDLVTAPEPARRESVGV